MEGAPPAPLFALLWAPLFADSCTTLAAPKLEEHRLTSTATAASRTGGGGLSPVRTWDFFFFFFFDAASVVAAWAGWASLPFLDSLRLVPFLGPAN